MSLCIEQALRSRYEGREREVQPIQLVNDKGRYRTLILTVVKSPLRAQLKPPVS